MENLFEFFNKNIGDMALSIVAAIYASVSYFFLTRVYKKKEKNKDVKTTKEKEQFFKALYKGLVSSTIVNYEDLKYIYLGVREVSHVDEDTLKKWLYSFIVSIIDQEKMILNIDSEEAKTLDNLGKDKINEFKNIIKEYIKTLEEKSPFSDLPESEKSILNDMLSSLKHNDNDILKKKVNEISILLKSKNEIIEKTVKYNRWSIPLAVVGVILTIFFGVMTFIK